MKKLLYFSIMALFTITVNAQLKVDSLGNVGINQNPTADSKMIIQNKGPKTLYVRSNSYNAPGSSIYTTYSYNTQNADSVYTSALYGFTVTMGSGARAISTHGHASAYHGKYSIGVMGSASCLTSDSGNAFGIVGCFGNSNYRSGAGVYGASNNQMPPTLYQKYAGYFNGNTKVDGNLTVTGNISGTLLSKSCPSSLSSTTILENRDGDCIVAKLLNDVHTNSYYLEQPNHIKIGMKSPEDVAPNLIDREGAEDEADALLSDPITDKVLSPIDAQIYSKKHYGLNADELEEAFPDLVYENEDGTKSINYVEMVPLLVQAINELSAKISALEGGETSTKHAIPSATAINSADENVTILSLGQNKPNPFGETTSIAVSVPKDVQTAFLYVYNLNGNKVAQVDITARGATSVTLTAATLSEGMYLYSLVADGKIVETRRMIVEK